MMLQMSDEPHIAQVAHRGRADMESRHSLRGFSSSWRGWQLLQLQARKKLQQLQQAAIQTPSVPLNKGIEGVSASLPSALGWWLAAPPGRFELIPPLHGLVHMRTLWTLRASGMAALLPNWKKFAAQLGNKISPVRKKRDPIFSL